MSSDAAVDATTDTYGEVAFNADSAQPSPGAGALSLEWIFGFSKDIIGGLQNLTDASRDAVFYPSGHSGVVYDYTSKRQYLLQGHCNAITACAVSEDKRWIVTADAGVDSLVVVWDSTSLTPVKTLFNPHPKGVVALDMSPDALYIVTLSSAVAGETVQEVAVWEWTADRDGPVCACAIPTPDVQLSVAFNKVDVRQLVTNGQDRVVFWSWEEGKMKFFAPPVSQKDLRQPVGAFTVSQFTPTRGKAVTGTSDGDLVLWEGTQHGLVQPGSTDAADGGSLGTAARQDWAALKILHIVPTKQALEFVTSTIDYVITGSADGVVRVFDASLRIVAWFEDIAGGPITSVSFAASGGSVGRKLSDAPSSSLDLSDFVVGTRQSLIIGMQASLFEELSADQRRGTLLVQGMDDAVHGVAAHPYLRQFVLTCYSGAVHVWDYEHRQLLMVRLLDSASSRPHAVMYDVQGRFVAVGTTSGQVYILSPQYLTDTQPPLAHSSAAVTDIRFSNDGVFMAYCDADRYVYLYRYMPTSVSKSEHGTKSLKQWQLDEGVEEEKTLLERWIYLGRAKPHSKPITGLEFSMTRDGMPVLASISEDCCLVQYNLMESSITNGVVIIGPRARVEQASTPTTCCWYPLTSPLSSTAGAPDELMLVVANDDFKLKIWNAAPPACRAVRLGPTLGGPVNRLQHVTVGSEDGAPQCFVYSTADRVLGLVMLPLDGNPSRSMGLIAHPTSIACISASRDGKYVLSAGGADGCVSAWRINADVVARLAAPDVSMSAYLSLLEGGASGEFYQEMRDFFVYCQIRSQGEDAMSPRRGGDSIPVSELSNFMRAIGYYPTGLEVSQMIAEVRFSTDAGSGSAPKDSVTLDEAIKLYINHRPVLGVGKRVISNAVALVAAAIGRDGVDADTIPWRDLLSVLTSTGEAFSADELDECVRALTGEPLDEFSLQGKENVGGHEVTADLLGFEEM